MIARLMVDSVSFLAKDLEARLITKESGRMMRIANYVILFCGGMCVRLLFAYDRCTLDNSTPLLLKGILAL